MSEEPEVDVEVVDGEVPAMVEHERALEYIPSIEERSLSDLGDRHELALVMDANDVAMMLERVQEASIRKWVYRLPDGTMGLTIDAAQDITQLMNWSGKCRLTTLPELQNVERIELHGDLYWVADCFARDEVTGQTNPGTSMEPVLMQLSEAKAADWRKKGRRVGEDRKVLDVYGRTKAINKAYRNAYASFIPEAVEQAILVAAGADPSRVQPIQTQEEAKAADITPPLDTPEAKAALEECDELYREIRALGPDALNKLTPRTYHRYVLAAHHDMNAIARLKDHLVQTLTELPAQLLLERQQTEARESVKKARCPLCGANVDKSCMEVDSDGEVLKKDDKPKWRNQPHGERLRARLEAIQKENVDAG